MSVCECDSSDHDSNFIGLSDLNIFLHSNKRDGWFSPKLNTHYDLIILQHIDGFKLFPAQIESIIRELSRNEQDTTYDGSFNAKCLFLTCRRSYINDNYKSTLIIKGQSHYPLIETPMVKVLTLRFDSNKNGFYFSSGIL